MKRLIKARERAFKKQIQAEYNVIVSVKDIQTQFEENAESIDQIVSIFGSIRYAFKKKIRIAQAFFDPPSEINAEGDVNWRISIMNDLVSLCSLQKSRFRKTSRQRKNRIIECDSDAKCIWNAVTFKSFDFESKFQIRQFFSLKCKQYQCFYCLENRILFLKKRFHNLDSKFSLRRHFDRCHIFWSNEFCPFFHAECAVITLNSMMHFKNHAVKIHGIYMF